jgi:hypothetical protein
MTAFAESPVWPRRNVGFTALRDAYGVNRLPPKRQTKLPAAKEGGRQISLRFGSA